MKLLDNVSQGLLAFHSFKPCKAFRDLKPSNILLGPLGDWILMDLGSVEDGRVVISNRREAIALQERCAEKCTANYRAPFTLNLNLVNYFKF